MEVPHLRRVLAIGAHPDDCELLSGGTLARFASRGLHVTICAIARGDKGHRTIAPEKLSEIRQAEAAQAAAVIGAEFVSLGVTDGEISHTPSIRSRLIEIVRRVRPDLILTHWPDDYHADHRITGELVTDCSWFAASPGHRTDSPALDDPASVYHMDTLAGLGFEPTEYVDIASVQIQKEEMLGHHQSQIGATAQHGEQDLIALARDLGRLRGHQCGVAFAEGFRPCLKWKRVRPYRLLP